LAPPAALGFAIGGPDRRTVALHLNDPARTRQPANAHMRT
jgi:hypothetical protein